MRVELRWPDWMSKDTLAAYTDLKFGAIDQYVKRGLLPRPHMIGEAQRWSKQEVDDAIRGAEHDAVHSGANNPYLERIANAAKNLSEVRAAPARALREGQG